MDEEEAIQASRNGAYAAFVSAAFTTVFLLAALAANATDGTLAYFNDPIILADVVIIIACGIGMLRNSRAAAIIMFAYFVFAKIVLAMELGQISGVVLGLVFLYFFGKAIQGSFTYHWIQREENPNYKPSGRWMYWLGIPSSVLLILAMSYALLSVTGFFPSTRVLAGDELPRNQYEQLLANEIVLDDELIEYFYSESLFSVLGAGNILTDRRVISYYTDENGLRQIGSIDHDEIVSVETIDPGSAFSDGAIKLMRSILTRG